MSSMPASRTPSPVQSFPCNACWQAPFLERAHTQATESVSGHSLGRFGGSTGEKTGTHDGRSVAISCMGVDSQRPGSASTLAGHFFFYGTQAQGRHGEHGLAGGAVRCGTPPGQAGHA